MEPNSNESPGLPENSINETHRLLSELNTMVENNIREREMRRNRLSLTRRENAANVASRGLPTSSVLDVAIPPMQAPPIPPAVLLTSLPNQQLTPPPVPPAANRRLTKLSLQGQQTLRESAAAAAALASSAATAIAIQVCILKEFDTFLTNICFTYI